MSAPDRSRAGKRREVPAPGDVSVADDPFVREAQLCIERVTEADRPDLLEDLVVGLREILHHPASLAPDPRHDWVQGSRRDPDA